MAIAFAAAAFVVSVAALLVVLVRSSRSDERMRELERVVAEQAEELADLRSDALSQYLDTRSALQRAERDNRKADALLGAAASLTGTADAASKLAYRAVTNPFVKIAAAVTGTKQAAKELTAPKPAPIKSKRGRAVGRLDGRRKSARMIEVSSREQDQRKLR
jgi:type II secretory pathway pseudopilin PulG